MKINPGSRVKLTLTTEATFDPTGSTIELSVDGVWHPATWLGTPTATGSKWTQSAETTEWFAGPVATANGAVVLATGRRSTEGRLTNGGQVIAFATDPIDVQD